MFNQEPAEEQGQISEVSGNEAEPGAKEGNNYKDHNSFQDLTDSKTQNLDYNKQKSEIENQTLELKKQNSILKNPKPDQFKRSISEPCSQVSNCEDQSSRCLHAHEGCGCESRRSYCSEEAVDCVLQVDNGSEGDDGFLQREGSQRRSRRRFRRVNPRGEREVITDGQEPSGYNTVRVTPKQVALYNEGLMPMLVTFTEFMSLDTIWVFITGYILLVVSSLTLLVEFDDVQKSVFQIPADIFTH